MRLKRYLKEGIREYLVGRDVILDDPRFPVFTDTEKNIAYFPLFNLSGKFIGYQRLNPEGLKWSTKDSKTKIKKSTDFLKYDTRVTRENPEKNIKHLAVYGLHTLDKRPFVFVVEGVFDAVKLIRLNFPVIAVLSNHPKPLKNFLFALQKKVIAVLDRDDAGSKLKTIAHKYIMVPEPYKDLGDMPLEEVQELVKLYK